MADNKMEQVEAMNNFEKLLGRNGELVELRKKQVIDGAIYIIQRHYADKQNKMEVVAQLFEKEFGESFKVKDLIDGETYVASFGCYGMSAYNIEGFHQSWKPRRDLLMRLIVGEAVIVDA